MHDDLEARLKRFMPNTINTAAVLFAAGRAQGAKQWRRLCGLLLLLQLGTLTTWWFTSRTVAIGAQRIEPVMRFPHIDTTTTYEPSSYAMLLGDPPAPGSQAVDVSSDTPILTPRSVSLFDPDSR